MDKLNQFIRKPEALLSLALICLLSGLLFGLVGVLQYLVPDLWKGHVGFRQIRPLHVSSMLFWILLGAQGSVLVFMNRHQTPKNTSYWLPAQFLVFVLIFLLMLFSYGTSQFGGREYWEFPPPLAAMVLLGFILFGIQVVSFFRKSKSVPIYGWMWLTGIAFFIFTLGESYLWLLPGIRQYIIQDTTLQWKANGSMVGSWNMLIYGCSTYLMQQFTGNHSSSKTAWYLYFVGLTNLMFNWGHHIYTLPTEPYIRHISYLISMTELGILARMLMLWRRNRQQTRSLHTQLTFQLLFKAEIWILLNLFLAILISVPAMNRYTHGTHITVAHAMGATIGINSFLLLAFIREISGSFENPVWEIRWQRLLQWMHYSLLLFWLSLIAAGILKAWWQHHESKLPFARMMQESRPFFMLMLIGGIGLIVSMGTIGCCFLKTLWNKSASVLPSPPIK